MLKRIAVVICGVGVILMTSGLAAAQAVDTAQEKTKAAATKVGAVISDAEITTAVKTKLSADKTVGASNIDVDTNNGAGTLHGTGKRAAGLRPASPIAA